MTGELEPPYSARPLRSPQTPLWISELTNNVIPCILSFGFKERGWLIRLKPIEAERCINTGSCCALRS